MGGGGKEYNAILDIWGLYLHKTPFVKNERFMKIIPWKTHFTNVERGISKQSLRREYNTKYNDKRIWIRMLIAIYTKIIDYHSQLIFVLQS